MPQCLECGSVAGELGSYFTCNPCYLAGRGPREYRPETEVRFRAADPASLVAGVGKHELHFTVQKNRGQPMGLTEKLPNRTRVIYRVSWFFNGEQYNSEYADLPTAQWNARDIESYEHIQRVRIAEIHEDREPLPGVFQVPTRFEREDVI